MLRFSKINKTNSLSLLVIAFLTVSLIAQTSQPLSLADILTGLRSKKVTLVERNRLLTDAVVKRGITFKLTAEIESELVKTGASVKLIEALRQKSGNDSSVEEIKPKPSPPQTNNPQTAKVKPISDNDLTNEKEITSGINYYSEYTNSNNLSSTDKASAFKLRADLYSQKGKYEAAIADYETALSLNPNDSSVYYERGFIYYNNLENLDAAILDFTKTIKLDSKFTLAYLWRGHCYLQKNELNLALADFNKADELSPNSYWLIYEYRANTFEKLGKKESAEADRKKARSLNF